MSILQDGTGTSISAKVDKNNQLHVFSVSESEQNAAVEDGDAYNINTGLIALTGTSDSAILFIKNDEAPVNGESDLVIDTVIIGIFPRTATVETAKNNMVTIIRNPTAGTVVDDATACPMKSNANFGSSNELDSLIYIGADGKTLTDGSDHAIIMCSEGRTTIPQLHIDLPKGSSIGIKVDLNTSGGASVYAAVVCHRKDGNNNRS